MNFLLWLDIHYVHLQNMFHIIVDTLHEDDIHISNIQQARNIFFREMYDLSGGECDKHSHDEHFDL